MDDWIHVDVEQPLVNEDNFAYIVKYCWGAYGFAPKLENDKVNDYFWNNIVEYWKPFNKIESVGWKLSNE